VFYYANCVNYSIVSVYEGTTCEWVIHEKNSSNYFDPLLVPTMYNQSTIDIGERFINNEENYTSEEKTIAKRRL